MITGNLYYQTFCNKFRSSDQKSGAHSQMRSSICISHICEVIKCPCFLQVVTASPGVRTSVPNVTIDSAGRPQVSVASTLASALAGTIKVAPSVSTAQQHALLTQVRLRIFFQCVMFH